MGHSPNIETLSRKRELNTKHRQAAVIALTVKGWTQERIAKEFGVNRKTIQRDLDDIRPAQEIVASILDRAQAQLRATLPVEVRVDKLVETLADAKEWKQPGIALQVLQRMDAIDGLVTDSERMRSKAAEPQAIAPMFSLPAGATISVTVSTSTERDVIDVTPQVTSSETHKL